MNIGFEEFCSLAEHANIIPLYKNILCDTETPVSAMLKLKKKPAFLLESVVGGEKWARYSFLCLDPVLTIQGSGKKYEITNGRRAVSVVSDDPLSIVKDILRQFSPHEPTELPRFSGGFVGYLAYDVVRAFERLPQRRKPAVKVPDTLLMLFDTILIFDNLKQTLSILANAHTGVDITLNGKTLFPSKKKADLKAIYQGTLGKINRIAMALQKTCVMKAPLSMPQGTELLPRPEATSFKSNFMKADFLAAVDRSREYVHAGDVVQVVISQRFERPCSAHPFTIYRALRMINPSPYMFYFDIGDAHIVGSSPEILVRLEGDRITVRPIAGTRKRGRTDEDDRAFEEDMKRDPKEVSEHIMLVDLGRNDVGRVSEIGSVKVTDLMITEFYSHVMHLVSNVEGKLKEGCDAFDVFRACFPAGTVSGAPKVRAMEIIEELEPTKRGVYAGSVGYFSYSGNMDTCIAIRTLVIKDGKVYFQTGAGIVADSVPENEYWESVNKAMAMMTAVEFVERKKK
ncbi:MAG TPA: anthranilate synthase component I [Dissulfurispiraceae bacterium]|nr:anthranilate synthase component I [Dissulfurispiraceae bacterium]